MKNLAGVESDKASEQVIRELNQSRIDTEIFDPVRAEVQARVRGKLNGFVLGRRWICDELSH